MRGRQARSRRVRPTFDYKIKAEIDFQQLLFVCGAFFLFKICPCARKA